MKTIQPVVEGHGEVEALPVLLRRLRDEASAWKVGIGTPIANLAISWQANLGLYGP